MKFGAKFVNTDPRDIDVATYVASQIRENVPVLDQSIFK
jgi:hypothetical protein